MTIVFGPKELAVLFTPIVWPSDYPKLGDFLEFVKETYFQPSYNTRLEVVIKDLDTTVFFTDGCKRCKEKFEGSNIIEAVKEVEWALVGSSTFNVMRSVSV